MKENIIKRWSKKVKPWGFEELSIYDVTFFLERSNGGGNYH